jgi:hypothetical protein
MFTYDLLPYFYGSHILFNFGLSVNKHKKFEETFSYKWILSNADESEVYKEGEGSVLFASNLRRRQRSNMGIIKYARGSDNVYIKKGALDIGYLSVPKQYKLRMLIGTNGDVSTKETVMAEFTLKDRDDYYLNIMQLLIGAIFGAIFGVVASLLAFMLFGGQNG